ncbi:MAG: transposase [Candidatus Micrarchaeota archaeon]
MGLIDKINDEFGVFDRLFPKTMCGKAKYLKETVKLFVANRLDQPVSVNRLLDFFCGEKLELLGFKKKPSQRSLYRNLERVGRKMQIILAEYQQILKEKNLVTEEQFPDFTSSYFEGKKCELAELGYSRDQKPGKKQLTIGASVGTNNIPTTLAIQKGNVVDNKHFKPLYNTLKKVLPPESLLVFDCGANTKANKKMIREDDFHYLTLKQKQRGPYKKYIKLFKSTEKTKVKYNDAVEYECVKVKEKEQAKYIFYSQKLKNEQIRKKKKKFTKQLEKNEPILKKVKNNKMLDRLPTNEGYIETTGAIQKILKDMPNPFITGLEGYFILESSLNIEAKEVLQKYKERDKVEKLIRNMKEGAELRPMRHWSKYAVIGYLFMVFLTQALINLTHLLAKNSFVKNTKLLTKYLQKLTLTYIYPKNRFRFTVLSNILPEIESLIGQNIRKYDNKPPDLRW